MSLVTEINRTNTEKNKAKTVKEQINLEIVSEGGIKADTFAEIPERIKNILKNYKKCAYLKLARTTYTFKKAGEKKEIIINTNTLFTPTKFVVCFYVSTKAIRISKMFEFDHMPNSAEKINDGGVWYNINYKELTKDRIIFEIEMENMGGQSSYNIEPWEIFLIE